LGRDYRPNETARRNKAKRDCALARIELRGHSEARTAAVGATSFAVKERDPETERIIREALQRRNKGLDSNPEATLEKTSPRRDDSAGR
jgi:hypothetical protein